MRKSSIENVKDKFAENMRLGIIGPESGGRYDAQNSEGSAAGKYQFTKFWLKSAKDKSIQAFAKRSNGVFKVPETMEDFKADKILQDAYFDYYAKEVLFPQAEKAYNGPNPAELTLEEMGALFHFKGPNDSAGGTGAGKQIRTGKFDEATKKGKDGSAYTNSSSKGYINHFKRTLESSGGKLLEKAELVDSGLDKITDPDEIYNEFIEANRAIDEMDNISSQNKELLRREIYQDVANKGNTDIVNEALRIQKKEEQDRFNAVQNFQDVFANADFESIERKIDGKPTRIYKNISTPFDQGDVEKLIKDFPELKEFLHIHESNGKKQIVVNQRRDSGRGGYDNKTIPEFNEKVNQIFEETYGKDAVKSTLSDDDEEFWEKAPALFALTKAKDLFSGVKQKDGTFKIDNGEGNAFKSSTPDLIDNVQYKPQKPERKEAESEKESKKEEAKPAEEVVSEEVENKEAARNDGEEYYNRALGLYDTTEDDFAMGKTKREMPIDLVMGGMLTAIGNKKAKEKIPLRDEEMSNAFNRFAAELAEKSKLGLPVEVEAKMKADLAEVYQGGLENIKNASGGNRALVLGNQASLENAKMKGTVDIQMADYAAKERAFQQYGQAVMYKNEFDSRRDIANHGIEYNEAKEKQMEGRSIAAQGMNQMMEGIKYQKENGPGSANAMYKSLMMQKMFGFDPNMVDDGTGKKGTKSAYDMRKQKDLEGKLALEEDYRQFGILNPEQKKITNQMIRNTNDPKKIRSFQQHLINNPDLDLSKVKMDNLDIASQREDWGMLTMDRAKAIDAPINDKPLGLEAPNTINLTPEQLNGQGGALEPLPELNAFGSYEGDDKIKQYYESKGLA